MNDKAYWLWLQKALGTGIKTDEIVAYYKTAKEIFFASPEDRVRSGVFTKNQLEKLKNTPLEVVNELIEDCRKCRCRILTPDDERYPRKLLEIRDFPLVLYYYGNPEILKDRMTIAIVGTRRATEKGMQVSFSLANSLAVSGAVIVSGGASGIDGAAHMGAMHNDKETVAVLGCGFMAKYHDSAEVLKEDILKKGLIITEYPPQTPPNGKYFPVRNRIISGLSYGVVVTECPVRSGSLITARLASEQGREVFALPVDVSDANTSGAIELIRNNRAVAVYSCFDILSKFEFDYPYLIDYSNADTSDVHEFKEKIDFTSVTYSAKKRTPSKSAAKEKEVQQITEKQEIKKDVNLTGNAKTVYDVLKDEPMHIDDITRNVPSLNVGKIMVSLTQLEMKGLVVSDSGKKYRRK
ncbi:MAG: DNA-processing protein DprA [Clostridia bacterium]|nr:DNA-processing protein DprA [Clostridia bacterium]